MTSKRTEVEMKDRLNDSYEYRVPEKMLVQHYNLRSYARVTKFITEASISLLENINNHILSRLITQPNRDEIKNAPNFINDYNQTCLIFSARNIYSQTS